MYFLRIFIGVFILSLIGFSLMIGIFMTYFNRGSMRKCGIALFVFGILTSLLSYLIGLELYRIGRVDYLWSDFMKVEAFFANLGAFLGVVAALGLIAMALVRANR
jgi:hypothetical protein